MATKKQMETLWKEMSIVDPTVIVTKDNRGIIYIGGEMAEPGRLSNLRAEAEFFLQSDLWKIIFETPKELAHRAMFTDAESMVDLQKGKSMLFMLQTQKKIIEIFKSYSQSPVKK